MSATTGRAGTAVMTYREALRLALREELSRDDRVFLMGEEVGFGDRAVVGHERFAVAGDAIHAARRAISASREAVGSPWSDR
jgi:hypothetical protein